LTLGRNDATKLVPSGVVIDEVQRVPQLLPVVHQIMESPGAPAFIMTGSSARKLRRAGVDLLAGRALMRTMHPFMAAEMTGSFDLATNLKLGTVPLVVSSDTREKTLDSYIDLYLEQEVRAEGLVRRLDDFARFLEIASYSHGQVLSVAPIARECAASRNTVESYIGILEDLLIAVRVPVFSRRAKRALVSHGKFYFFDCGVYRAIRPSGPLDPREQIEGPALEGLVLQHLRAWIEYGDMDLSIHYWRTRAGTEVDFVLYGGSGFHAIEVKNSVTVRAEDLRGLRSFLEDYPEADAYLLYRGDETIERDLIRCMPADRFLRELIPGRRIPR
jgi:uncharacterized protein